MPDGNMTPEEKLLRIIENPSGAMGHMRRPRPRQDFKLTFKLLKAKYGPRFKEFVSIKAVNAVLFCISILITVFLSIDFWLGIPRATAISRLELLAKAQNIGDLVINRLDPLELYLQEIAQRNIFSLPQPKEVAEEVAPVKTSMPEARVAKVSQNLKLVGIIWSDVPQAIMEDTARESTHLVSRGSFIKGMRVKEILKDRVILSYDDHELEIK